MSSSLLTVSNEIFYILMNPCISGSFPVVLDLRLSPQTICSNRRRVAINIGLKRAVFFAVVQPQSIPAGGICRIDTLQLVAEIKLVNMVILSHAGSICRVVSCPQEPNKRNDFLKVWSTQLNSLQRQAEHGDSGKRGSVCWLIISFLPSIDSSLWLSVVNLNWSAASFLTFISQTDERFSRKSPNYLALQKCNKSLKIQFWFCASVVGLPVLSLGILFFSRQASTNAVGSFHPPEQPSEKCLNNSNLSNVYFEMHPPSLPSSALQFLFIRRFIRAAPDTLTTCTADSK